jgi:hypothetical protein
VDKRARIRLQLRLLLVIWRREIRRLAESEASADARAARMSELRVRAHNVLGITADQIHAAGNDPEELEQFARAHGEIDADGEET